MVASRPCLCVWAEEMGPVEIEPLLAELGGLGLRLHLAMPRARLGDPELAALTRRAADSGVETRAWLLLPREDGYWIGKHNAGLAKEAVLRLLRWQRSAGGPCVGGLSIDLEPPLQRTPSSAGSSAVVLGGRSACFAKASTPHVSTTPAASSTRLCGPRGPEASIDTR